MSEKVLLTGGAGFIGHHLIRHLLSNTDWDIIFLDRQLLDGLLKMIVGFYHKFIKG